MQALILRTIKNQKVSLGAYIVIAAAFVWMYVALFPGIAKESEKLTELMATYPEGFLKAFGIDPSTLIFSNLENFLSLEYYSFLWPLIVIILLISYGSAAIAGEIEKGTIEILLSLPLSRLKIFAGKYLSGLFILLLFTLFSVFAAIPLAQIYTIDFQFAHHLNIAMLGTLFGLAIFSLTMMFSCIFSERGKVASVVGGILIVMYALNIVAKLQENLDKLKYLSFFHYYDFSAALIQGKVDPLAVLVFLGVSIICTLVGLFYFNKRDIAV